MTEALDPEPLLRALHNAGVRQVIIGGFAVNAHGVIRPSKDLDPTRTYTKPRDVTHLRIRGLVNGSVESNRSRLRAALRVAFRRDLQSRDTGVNRAGGRC